MDVDVDVRHCFVAVPASDLLDHQLQLVEKLRIDRRVARPLSLLIVVQEIADFEVLGDRQIDVRGAYLEESLGRWGPAPHALPEISPDAISTQHSLLFLRERHQHRECEAVYGSPLASLEKGQMIKARLRRRGDFVASKGRRRSGEGRIA